MIEGMLGRIRLGDCHPVRVMAVINLSQESFYKGSVAKPGEVLPLAYSLAEEGADLLDLGAVSTAPGSPPIGEAEERERLFPALRQILENLEIEVSVDTQRPGVAEEALSIGAACINDVSGLRDPRMAGAIADHGGSGIIMASRDRPGDLLTVDDIISVLAERMGRALEAGIPPERIAVDPGVGRWVPKKAPEYDLAILDGLRRLRTLGRPVMAALSRKSFIGARLDKPDPSQRLCGSLAATAIAVYNGAHIVRTHDVSASLDVIRMAQAARPLPPRAEEGEVAVEVWEFLGREVDLLPSLRRRGVDEEGARILCRKGSFRVLEVSGINSMEAIIIKQEMLARGGDAAIPRLALRCHPGPMRVVIFGTASQLSGLARKLKGQPFNLPAVGSVIESALDSIGEPGRYR